MKIAKLKLRSAIFLNTQRWGVSKMRTQGLKLTFSKNLRHKDSTVRVREFDRQDYEYKTTLEADLELYFPAVVNNKE